MCAGGMEQHLQRKFNWRFAFGAWGFLIAYCLLRFTQNESLILHQNLPLIDSSYLDTAEQHQRTLTRHTINGNPTKLVFIIVDGLRFDAMQQNSDLRAFLEHIHADSLIYKLRAQTPTLSHPNWITLLSGASPEVHGRMGNESPEEIGVDHILRVAARTLFWTIPKYNATSTIHRKLKENARMMTVNGVIEIGEEWQQKPHQLHRGITGPTEWLSHLVRSSLEPLRSDGTIPMSAVQEDDDAVCSMFDVVFVVCCCCRCFWFFPICCCCVCCRWLLLVVLL